MTSSNEEVIELLESYLETARKYPFGSIAVAMVGHPGVAACDFAGEVALETSTMEALGLVATKLKASIDNWTLPKQDPTLGKDHVCYNLANGPLSFDFLVWLVDAIMTCIREGFPLPLKVGFWLGQNGKTTPSQAAWLANVFRPALRLVDAVEEPAAVFGHNKKIFVPRDIVAAFNAGESVPQFKSHLRSPFPGAVTITLREIRDNTGRNSNLEAWVKFAALLQDEGENVVVVRDTALAHEPFWDFTTCPEASIELDKRMALYQEAKANLFVANGPATLAHFTDRPWLEFIKIDDPDCPADLINTTDFWRKNMGIVPGEQFPWSNDRQRIVWARDSYENIIEAWRALRL
jgi:hypothetical protein